MKQIFILLFAIISTAAFAQDTTKATKGKWEKGGTLVINFNETGYKDWSTITDDVIATNGLFSAFAKYSKGKHAWDNALDIVYGQTMLSSIGHFHKSDDNFNFTSKYGYKASQHWFYTALFNFKTIMTPGYIYLDPSDDSKKKLNSNFLSPGRVEFSLGMDYKPNDNFSLFFSPIANRLSICLEDSLLPLYLPVRPGDKNKGVTNGGGKHTRYEFGAALKAKYQKDIVKNVNLKANLELFTDYLDKKHNVDILGDVMLSFKVNKYIGATAGFTVICDDDIAVPIKTLNTITNKMDYSGGRTGPRTQFKHTIGIGFSYKM